MSFLGDVFSGTKSIIKGMRVTVSYLFSKKVTLQYPEQRPQLTQRFRGIPALPIDPATGRDKCIACSACQRVCPDQVIVVVAEVGEDKKRRLQDFTLDTAGCIFCGLCVEVCPTGAIIMSDEFELAHSTREDLVLGLDKLHEIGGFFPPPEPVEEQEEKAEDAPKDNSGQESNSETNREGESK